MLTPSIQMGVGPSLLSLNLSLYVGSIRDATDKKKLTGAAVTHILSILSAKQIESQSSSKENKFTEPLNTSKLKRLLVTEEDQKDVDLSQHFRDTSSFIHTSLWVDEGNVLVHCMMGKSRSVTIATAYLITITGLDWLTVLNAIRCNREVADPNCGFKEQLRLYQQSKQFEDDRTHLDKTACIPDEVRLCLANELSENANLYLKRISEDKSRQKEMASTIFKE